ncbi:MAG: CoA transferase, partial [Cyclobacteriaceae bacterium]
MSSTPENCNSIIQSIPARFRPQKAEGYQTTVHFEISGDKGTQFTVEIADQHCNFKEGLHGEAVCVVRAKAKHYAALESGEINPQLAILTGKVKVSNINEMLRFSKCFIPYYKFNKPSESIQKKDRKPSSGPLLGYRVLDLSRLLPGPWATAMLADMGAEVIKIEDPESPDYVRDYPPIIDGKSANYMAWNRSKRSAAISLRTPEGKQQFMDMIKSADVVVEQFRPGVIDQWGLGYEEAKKVNPKIIYVSLTGFGQTGPMAHTAGHDLNYLALSGVLSLNKDERGKP